MAKKTVVFTYTIPAKDGQTVAPAAPIRCGCDNIIFILKDPALTIAARRGIIEAVIREVAVSAKPLAYTDPSSGVVANVWRYDYTFEYETNDFLDPTTAFRKCMIQHNCCRGCAQEYTDRILGGYVQSVQGADVDNSDPQNPVVPPETITSIQRIVTPGQANIVAYNNENAQSYSIVEGIATISAPAGCNGIGASQAIQALSIDGTTLNVQSAAMPSFVGAGAVDALDPGAPIYVIPVQFYDINEIIIDITNPNPCYVLQGMFHVNVTTFISPMSDSTRLELLMSLVNGVNGDSYQLVDMIHAGATPPGAPQGATLQCSRAVNLNELFPAGIAPGATGNVRLRVRLNNTTGGAPVPGSFLTNSYADLRFMGVAMG